MRRWGSRLAAVLPAWALAASAQAHDVAATGAPGWTFSPWVVGLLSLSGGLYAIGWVRLSRRARRGQGRLRRSALLFALGWAALAAAAVSPLHEAGERSFTLHMIEHEVIMLVGTPLLVLARPIGVMAWGLPHRARMILVGAAEVAGLRGFLAFAGAAVPATLIQAAALWLWHAPGLFDLALARPGWHIVQHLSFLIPSLLFWQAMLGPGRAPAAVRVLCLFATSVVAGALGALMAVSSTPWYARYAALGLAPFGLTPTEDQQLAGLLMWIPGGLVHVAAALLVILPLLTNRPSALMGSERPGTPGNPRPAVR